MIAITEASVVAKDYIIYAAFENLNDIHEIHVRVAECRNSNIVTRSYIPPQFFQRYIHISECCKEIRDNDREIKTQMRFGDNDIELMVKERGSEEPFRRVDFREYMKEELIPEYDHSKKWKARTDRPPRRRCDYMGEKKTLPSHGAENPPPHMSVQPMIKQDSLPRKKARTEDTNMAISDQSI